jgi:hypothetical protein
MIERLERWQSLSEDALKDYDTVDETANALEMEEGSTASPEDLEALRAEINELKNCRSLAKRIQQNAKAMAVIAFDFSSIASCPSTRRLASAQALTLCSGLRFFARSRESRVVLPSTAITSPALFSRTPLGPTHKATPKTFRGQPGDDLGNTVMGRHTVFQGNESPQPLQLEPGPNSAIPSQPSAPLATAQTVRTRMSINPWSFLRSIRGSCNSEKCSTKLLTQHPGISRGADRRRQANRTTVTDRCARSARGCASRRQARFAES